MKPTADIWLTAETPQYKTHTPLLKKTWSPECVMFFFTSMKQSPYKANSCSARQETAYLLTEHLKFHCLHTSQLLHHILSQLNPTRLCNIISGRSVVCIASQCMYVTLPNSSFLMLWPYKLVAATGEYDQQITFPSPTLWKNLTTWTLNSPFYTSGTHLYDSNYDEVW